jgi:hypothetical protein
MSDGLVSQQAGSLNAVGKLFRAVSTLDVDQKTTVHLEGTSTIFKVPKVLFWCLGGECQVI